MIKFAKINRTFEYCHFKFFKFSPSYSKTFSIVAEINLVLRVFSVLFMEKGYTQGVVSLFFILEEQVAMEMGSF